MENKIQSVRKLIDSSQRILFITGAGVSAESGIPTFRGATSAFKNGMTDDGMSFEELLSATTFRRDPQLAWKYFNLLHESLIDKQPNAAHLGMAALERAGKHICIATQNIDGLHQLAGSTNVLEMHGSLLRTICTRCHYQVATKDVPGELPWPRCPRPTCASVLRPDIVLYEENLPEGVMEKFEGELLCGFDLIFSVGTTSQFHYVTLPIRQAVRQNIPVVEINPEETSVSDLVHFRFAAKAGEFFEKLFSKS